MFFWLGKPHSYIYYISADSSLHRQDEHDKLSTACHLTCCSILYNCKISITIAAGLFCVLQNHPVLTGVISKQTIAGIYSVSTELSSSNSSCYSKHHLLHSRMAFAIYSIHFLIRKCVSYWFTSSSKTMLKDEGPIQFPFTWTIV